MGNSHSEQVEQQTEKTPPWQGRLEKVKREENETPKKTDQTETMCLFSTSKTVNHVPCLVKGTPVGMGQASLYPTQASPSPTLSQEDQIHMPAVATSSAPIIVPLLSQSTPRPLSQEMDQASKTQLTQQRPAVVAPKPQVTEQRPALVAPKPQVTEQRPAVVAPKPQVTQQRPAVVAPKPQVTQQRPAVVAPEPQVTEQRPAVVAPKLQVTQQRPAVGAPKPRVMQQRPAVVAPKPRVTQQRPMAVKDVRASFWSPQTPATAPVETQQTPPTKNIPFKEPEKTARKSTPIRISHPDGTPVTFVELKCTLECPDSRLSQSTVDLKDTGSNKGTMKGSGNTPHTDFSKPKESPITTKPQTPLTDISKPQTPPTASTNLQGWLRKPIKIRRPDGTTASYDELKAGLPRKDITSTPSGDPGNSKSTTSSEDVQDTSSSSLKAPPNLVLSKNILEKIEQTMECMKDQQSQIPPATLLRQAAVKAALTGIPLSQAFKTTPKFKPARWDSKAQKAKSSESGYNLSTSAQITKPAGQPQTNRFPASKPDKSPVTPAAPVLNFPAPIPNNGSFSLGADIPSIQNGEVELSKTQPQSQNKTNPDEAQGTKTTTSSTLTGSITTSSTLTGSITTGSTLTGSIMTGSTLTGSIMTSSNLTGSITTGSTLTGSIMTGSTLTGSIMTSSTLTGSTLTGSIMTGSTLTDSNMTSSTLTGSIMTGSTLTDGNMTSNTLTGSITTGSTLTDGNMTSSTLTDGNMTSSTLTDGSMTSSTLTDGSMTSSTLTDGSMTSSTLTDSSMTSSTLTDGSMTSSTPTDGNMTSSTLTGSTTTGSNLIGSTKSGSTLIASTMTGSNLFGSTTTSSTLTGSTTTSNGELDPFLSKLSPSSLNCAGAARQRLKEMRTRFIKETSKGQLDGSTGQDPFEGSPQNPSRPLEPRPAPPRPFEPRPAPQRPFEPRPAPPQPFEPRPAPPQPFEPPRPAPPQPFEPRPAPPQPFEPPRPAPIYTRRGQQATPPTEDRSPQQKQADVTEASGKAKTHCNNLHRFNAKWPIPLSTERMLDEAAELPGKFQQYANEFHHPDGSGLTDLYNVRMQFHGNESESLPDPLDPRVTVGSLGTVFQDPTPLKALEFPIPPEKASTRLVSPPKSRKKQKQAVAQAKALARSAGKVARRDDKNEGQKTEDIPPASSPSPELPPRPSGCWHPFTVDGSCRRRARCQHGGTNEALPPNVTKWLNVNRNHLCEPPWVTTAKLAVVLALRESNETSQ